MKELEKILNVLSQIEVYSFGLITSWVKSDLLELLSQVVRMEISRIDQLPKGVSLELLELQNIQIQEQTVTIQGVIRIIGEQHVLLPDTTDLNLTIDLAIQFVQGFIQLSKPLIKIEAIDQGWRKKILRLIIERVIYWNDKKLAEIIDSKVNVRLRESMALNTLIANIPLEKKLGIDYQMLTWKGADDPKTLNLDFDFHASLGAKLDRAHAYKGLKLQLVKESVMKDLLARINKDIEEKIEQNVLIHSLTIPSENTIVAKGHVEMMNIRKAFELDGLLEFDAREQVLQLKVRQIQIDGAYLVRKAFELVEPRIRERIESSVRFRLGDFIQGLEIPVNIPTINRPYSASFSALELEGLSINSRDALLLVDITYDRCICEVKSATTSPQTDV